MSLLITLGLGSDLGGGNTPFMGLDIPVVSSTVGPLYAEDVNQSLFTIDAHDHTFGNGKSVPVPGGVTVTSDWNFGGYSITNLVSTRYAFQSSPLSSLIVGAVYASGVDLYYNDGNGNQIQITEAGSVNVTAGKGFSGDFGMPGVPATVPYTAASHVFDFYEDPGGPTWAILGIGAIRLHGAAGTQADYLAVVAPSLSNTWTYTLPANPPTASDFGLWQQDHTGAVTVPSLVTPGSNYSLLGFSTANAQTLTTLDGTTLVWSTTMMEVGVIGTANIANDAVTQPKLGAAGFVTNTGGGASGNLTTQASYTALPNTPSVSITLTALRPIGLHQNLIFFAASSSGGGDSIQLFYDIYDGASHLYLPCRVPGGQTNPGGIYLNQTDGGETNTFTGAGDAAEYQMVAEAAATYTISLVYTANTSVDSSHFNTTAITMKAVVF